MTAYLFPGILGLLAGLTLHWSGFTDAEGLRSALALHRGHTHRHSPLRSGLSALGYAVAGSALLIWLAVLDVDDLLSLPLGWRVLAGGGLFGICAGLCGFTPSTAFAGLGAGNAPEALCILAGVMLAVVFLPEGEAVPAASGDLLMQGCAGLLTVVIALCIPNPKPAMKPEPASDTEKAAVAPETLSSAVPEEPELASEPEDDPNHAAEDAFVAILEGEEPLIVDTDPPDVLPEDRMPEDDSTSAL